LSFALYVILISSCVAYLLVLTSKSTGWLKLFAVLLLMHGYITGVTTLREVSGYPTVSKLPKEFEVIYGRIIEKEGDSFIELWVSYELSLNDKLHALFSMAGNMNDLTRVYRMPYSEENHEMILKIQEKILEGKVVGIILSDQEGTEIDLRQGAENYRIEHKGYSIQK
tara:strand:- start:217 stop:720 length:504 start_codon:yes stop_codon:yes gene_type:complete